MHLYVGYTNITLRGGGDGSSGGDGNTVPSYILSMTDSMIRWMNTFLKDSVIFNYYCCAIEFGPKSAKSVHFQN